MLGRVWVRKGWVRGLSLSTLMSKRPSQIEKEGTGFFIESTPNPE